MTEDEWKAAGIHPDSVFLEKDFLRVYMYPYETAHLLGFLGEISDSEMNNVLYSYQGYLTADRLGRMGLEGYFERKLRGTDGKELIEVDAQSNKIRTLGKIDAVQGQNITLSLDADLQKTAYEALGEHAGAVVVSRARSGELLALVSTPSFDPNKLHAGLTTEDFNALFKAPDKPMFNRAVSGVYAPGSTFKIVTALAGLESGDITKNTIIEDTGILRVGEFSFSNWYYTQYGKTEGPVDILRAIARSNDIYFYKLGEEVGIDTIAHWGKLLGVGQKTGIELPNEAEGIMPDRAYQKKIRGTDWYLGDSYHIAIGQGDLLTTPLQVNRWTNVVASNGLLCSFSLLKSDGTTKSCTQLSLKKETLPLIQEGMRRACSSGSDVGYQGTGWPLFDFSVTHEVISEGSGSAQIRKVPVGCKTGTSEFGDAQGKTHAWFTAYAPLPGTKAGEIHGDPEIVVTVLLEKGGEGSTDAGPIAKKILEEWFKR
jgi:penicillin-binding protein 2